MTATGALRGVGRTLYRCYHHLRSRSMLEPVIRGRRALIVGTGPSAADLGSIPDDVCVLTCKDGLRLFSERSERTHVDVYSCFRSGLERESGLPELFDRTRPGVFVSNDLCYVRNRTDLTGLYGRLMYDVGEDNTMLRRLIRPHTVEEIRGAALRAKTSTGMRLLQYALHFRAREVFLVGIDFGRDGYVWGSREASRPWNHADIDENLVRIVSQRHGNVFSLSASSPAIEYLPHRGF